MTQATGTTYLEISRIFDAPRESVDVDALAGGHQRLTMVSDANPADADRLDGTFTEVVENSVLDGYQDIEGIPGTEGIVRFQLRIELHDEPGGRTRLKLRQGPYTPEFKVGEAEGWESSLTKLDALLKLA
jgi:uncharacterized protein YndB with AHSA1/START domain